MCAYGVYGDNIKGRRGGEGSVAGISMTWVYGGAAWSGREIWLYVSADHGAILNYSGAHYG